MFSSTTCVQCYALDTDWKHVEKKCVGADGMTPAACLHHDFQLRAPEAPIAPVAMVPLGPPDIIHRFSYHRPEGNKVEDHEDVRNIYREFALLLAPNLPTGREKSLAFTALEESSFWAHAAIARSTTSGGE